MGNVRPSQGYGHPEKACRLDGTLVSDGARRNWLGVLLLSLFLDGVVYSGDRLLHLNKKGPEFFGLPALIRLS